MYAIVETGGKQYLMEEGKTFKIEKIEGEAGNSVIFDKILLVSDLNEENKFILGSPYVSEVQAKAQILETVKDKKVIGGKFRHKTGYRRKFGHRQFYTKIKVEKVELVN